MAGWNHDNANWNAKTCAYCASSFNPKSGAHKFCTGRCKGKYRREFGHYRTEAQYELISGDWGKYFSRLCNQKHRKGVISRDDCIRMLKAQDYKCALSGEELTCRLEKGVVTPTNASLDRINPKGPYTPDNVQLVCAVLNSFRNDTPLADFVGWCKKVVEYDRQKA